MTQSLATELAVGIATRLEHILGVVGPNPLGEPEGHVNHQYTTVFENGCVVLWEMGLATSGRGAWVKHDSGTPGPAYYRLASEKEIRARLVDAVAVPEDDLVSAYIGLACDYGDRWLPKSRDPFDAPDWAERQLGVLAENGYLDRVGSMYQWTDKVGPAMLTHYYWSEDFVDVASIEARALDRETELALACMPDFVRAAFSKGRVSAVVVVQRHWTGQDWSAEPARRVGLSFAIKLAERLETRL